MKFEDQYNEFLYLLVSQTQPGVSGIFIFYMVETHNDWYKNVNYFLCYIKYAETWSLLYLTTINFHILLPHLLC